MFKNTTKEDFEIIDKIVDRALALNLPRKRMDLFMDVCATHGNCPLRLNDLLEADKFNFLHDIYGIMSHLNRETGELEDCFLPRYAK